MRQFNTIMLASTSLVAASPCVAAEELKFGKPPAWVVPQTIPAAPEASADAPAALLLTDQQTQVLPGRLINYSEVAIKVQKPDGLAAGNISIPWNPATDTVTVNKLEIHRGSQIIDVLASGQKFTTLRRESALEMATLDGNLTANIQPEGLQEGDIINLATTIEHADPVMGQHVEANFADWPLLPIGRTHVRIEWPTSLRLNVKASGITAQPVVRGNTNIIELSANNVQPIIAPKAAPPRFDILRLGEATDFSAWADVAKLMQPLYARAEAVPSTGPLHDEVEKIRNSTSDPKLRAEKALQLVQDRVRYVALVMGQGTYVPASAETTWSRRFGDCKAKTALLLGILHALGIEAEPLLVQSKFGDAIGDRLPLLSYFDHVLVRARIGGRTYYLDGTRAGDTALDQIAVPDFGWALPVVANAALAHIVPSPLDRPLSETTVSIDARPGIYSPADVKVDQRITGDLAITLNSGLASVSAAQREEYFDSYWKKIFGDLGDSSSTAAFDKQSRQLHLSMTGKLKLDWSGGFFHLPLSSVGYTPDLDRPKGPFHDAPVAVAHPVFAKAKVSVQFPPDFFPDNIGKLVPEPVQQTLIGVAYTRAQSATRDSMTVETTTRSLTQEVSYKEAIANSAALKTLAYGDVSARLPATYRLTAADLPALKGDTSGTASDLVTKGNLFLDNGDFDTALTFFNKAIDLEPKNAIALADRGIAYAWKRDFGRAEADLKIVESMEPDNAVAARARGLIAEAQGNYKAAIEAYAKSLRFEPGNRWAFKRQIGVFREMGDDGRALAETAEALKRGPDIELRLLRANIFVLQEQPAAAAKEAQLLEAENPKSDYAMVAAARIYSRAGFKKEATAAFDRAIAIKPAAYIYLNRAQSRPLTAVSERIADLDKALSLEPENLQVLMEKAEELAAKGEGKAALDLYDKAAQIGAANDDIQLYRATLLYKVGDKAAAQRAISSIRSKAKSSTEFNNLCWRQATENILLDAALRDCQQALRLEPENGAAIDSLGFVNLRMGKYDEAIRLYNQAIAKSTGAASYMGRAIAYARKGEHASAQADRTQALKRDPDAEEEFLKYGLKY